MHRKVIKEDVSDPVAARKKAMDYLARREYSVYELSEKLKSIGFERAVADATVAKLSDEKLVDDDRFCESLTRSRVNRGFGPLRIVKDLRQRGVDDVRVNRAVNVADRAWHSRMKQVRDRKFGENMPQDVREWAKQARFLASRGFTSDQIRSLFNGRFESDSIDSQAIDP